MTRICPKCNYLRKDTDSAPEWQCPSCQVAYNKVGVNAEIRRPAPAADVNSGGTLKWILVAILSVAAIALARPLWQSKPERVDAQVATAQPTVVLYATSWCGYCAAARDFFETNGIQYTELDTEKTTAGYEGHKKLGGRGVPLIVIGDDVIRGYSEPALRQRLEPWLAGS